MPEDRGAASRLVYKAPENDHLQLMFSDFADGPIPPADQFLAHACCLGILNTVSIRMAREIMMEKLSTDELVRLAGIKAQDVISELAVADSAINLMMHDDSVSLETRGKLSLLIEQVRQAAAPAKQFIMLSRARNDTEIVQIDELISDLAPLLRRLLPKNIEVQIDVGSDLWPIKAHATNVEQALITLFVRARNAMPNGGWLLLRATNADETTCCSATGLRLLGDHILMEINDTGVGITPDYLRRIFDPFFVTKGPVNGFALAKAYWAIRDMDGHITVKSEIGKGTRFNVFMPRSLP